ncbi:DUF6282 family protein [Psychrobacillus sp. NPDC096389]|uniref:DUF6282 family protein n=1 Tax=Psychrobacillus sp. NPDC096389 TaxID=3364490 RepID=UPI0038288579
MNEELLEGAYDLHVHTGPDFLCRKLDDLEMAERIRSLGMKGYAIKSHHSSSAGRAKLINALYPEIEAIGALCLNHAVGGLNMIAAEMAARDGTKIIWMPTFDAKNEQDVFALNKPEKLPHWAKMQMELMEKGKAKKGISILDGDSIKEEVKDIVEIVKEYNLVLATGHLSPKEIYALAKYTNSEGFNKLVVTHPNFPSINLSKEQQKELVELGATMEYCFTTPNSKKVTWERVYEELKFVGVRNAILSTDLGQPNGMFPDEGLLLFINNLIENDFTRQDVQQMIVTNTSQLITV